MTRFFPIPVVMLIMLALVSCQRPVAETCDSAAAESIGQADIDRLANGHEYVDLGICNHLLWATMNIGATSPEQVGNHYAWGDTVAVNDNLGREVPPVTGSVWAGYRFTNIYSANDGNFPPMLKYNTNVKNELGLDGFITLQPEDDVAHVRWGGGWRMPYRSEFDSLLMLCKYEADTLNGVPGFRFHGRGEYSSNSIFFPNNGAYSGLSIIDGRNSGFYFSRSLMTHGCHNCVGVRLNPEYMCATYYYRYYAQGVRAVMLPGEKLVSQVSLETSELTIDVLSDSLSIQATVLPSDATNTNLFWFSTDNRVASVHPVTGYIKPLTEGECYISAISKDGTCMQSTCKVRVIDSSRPNHAYVDLGVSNHLWWATMNVGAESPSDYGDYFTWDEASRLDWGGHWRLPTSQEIATLLNNCHVVWTERDGVPGCEVFGPNVSFAYSNVSIFLPASGMLTSSGLQHLGKLGFYWASDFPSDMPDCAANLSFSSDGQFWNYAPRSQRFPVRMVYSRDK